jgi:hypothetical protein
MVNYSSQTPKLIVYWMARPILCILGLSRFWHWIDTVRTDPRKKFLGVPPIIASHHSRSGCLLRCLHPEPIAGCNYCWIAIVFKQSASNFNKQANHKHFLLLTLLTGREPMFSNVEFAVPRMDNYHKHTAQQVSFEFQPLAGWFPSEWTHGELTCLSITGSGLVFTGDNL